MQSVQSFPISFYFWNLPVKTPATSTNGNPFVFRHAVPQTVRKTSHYFSTTMFHRAYCDSYLELQKVNTETKREVRTISYISRIGDILAEADCRRLFRCSGDFHCLSVGYGEDDHAGTNMNRMVIDRDRSPERTCSTRIPSRRSRGFSKPMACLDCTGVSERT